MVKEGKLDLSNLTEEYMTLFNDSKYSVKLAEINKYNSKYLLGRRVIQNFEAFMSDDNGQALTLVKEAKQNLKDKDTKKFLYACK